MSTPSVLQSGSYSMPTTAPADTPPFLPQENIADIYSDGSIVRPQIDSKIEKGFFLSADNCWTCYRRNYFAVQCSYTLVPHPTGRPLQLVKGKETSTIQALAVTLTAAVDGAQGKSIELVQHTPKRDKGPQSTVGMVKLSPTPPGGMARLQMPHGYPLDTYGRSTSLQGGSQSPYLPLQNTQEASSSTSQQSTDSSYSNSMTLPSNHQHTFERIQFKSATANNGKRRAQQQYYHLIVELHADIRQMGDKDPKWTKVAQRVSQAVVVRGRSPSHYQNEGPHSARNPSVGGSGGGGVGYAAYGAAGYVPTSLSYGLGGSSTAYNSYSRPSGPVFTTLEPNPMGTFSNSSDSSLEMMHDAKPALMSPDVDAHNNIIKPLSTLDPFSYFKTRTLSLPLPPVTIPPATIPPLSSDLFAEEDSKKGDVSPAFPTGGLSSAWSTMTYSRDDADFS